MYSHSLLLHLGCCCLSNGFILSLLLLEFEVIFVIFMLSLFWCLERLGLPSFVFGGHDTTAVFLVSKVYPFTQWYGTCCPAWMMDKEGEE